MSGRKRRLNSLGKFAEAGWANRNELSEETVVVIYDLLDLSGMPCY